ncbi:hypothetical protein [Pseudomonas protegens]|nr:hypothetical protein [Pseudomonas protegens]
MVIIRIFEDLLSGYIASGKWDEKAHQKAAAAADEMLKEHDRRVRQAGS